MTEAAASIAATTPMMAQYLEIKGRYPDALLFYRMGDFYEMFFDDAVAASAALDIALTSRGEHLGQPIPMCGVPVVRAEDYLLALIRKGFRVAVAEQLEDPAEAKKRGSKAVVARDVVRLVTPGTLTEESLLEPRRANWLASVAEVRGEAAVAWCDISTGALRAVSCGADETGPVLARIGPREVLVAEGREHGAEAEAVLPGVAVTRLARAAFDSQGAEARLGALFGTAGLAGFGAFGRAEIAALGAVLAYLELTQRGQVPHLRPPQREVPGGVMQIDAATRRNLEIAASMGGGREGSLLAVVDRTVTGAGGRLLEARLAAPLTETERIAVRQEAVAWLVGRSGLRAELRAALAAAPDIDRALGRLSLGRGGPRDLGAVRDGLEAAARVAGVLAADGLPRVLARARDALGGSGELAALLAADLAAELPVQLRDGGLIAPGVDADLDATRALRDEGRGVIAGMQADYVRETGVASLKIRHNNVLGYFIETTAVHAERMMAPPLAARFVHRQTTANQVRFTTLELAEIETRILNAGARAQEIEAAHFARLAAAVMAAAAEVGTVARALAAVDVAAGLAEVAVEGGWCRPVVEQGCAFEVVAGRHPVVEAALARQGGPRFVPNDCALSGGGVPAIWLITGPNMGGKSTFLRQNALIAVLAQAGSFVPAASARIGVVTQLFSRVGASDELARGRSTFMVEMVETAAILNQAGEGALVILDEIGRGTATWDGLSIAWAVLEHLQAVNRCRGLFATHYHELTALAGRLEGVENATLAVREWQGEVIFLHEVRPGAADRSYGVQVARLAGLPAAAVARAREVLGQLEAGERQGGRAAAMIDDLPLFRAAPPAAPPPAATGGPAPAVARLRAINPDELSPREALDLIYDLRRLAE
ncbi:MAG TPA: DNA mismatch repair protein MutS [Paracoccaceae bacterium]|nr:DNA mismatch repair protein MutS [Paracoccaceae bacterium]